MSSRGGNEQSEIAAATAELLCATYVRHKPFLEGGYYACGRCRRSANAWTDWVKRGERLILRRKEGE